MLVATLRLLGILPYVPIAIAGGAVFSYVIVWAAAAIFYTAINEPAGPSTKGEAGALFLSWFFITPLAAGYCMRLEYLAYRWLNRQFGL